MLTRRAWPQVTDELEPEMALAIAQAVDERLAGATAATVRRIVQRVAVEMYRQGLAEGRAGAMAERGHGPTLLTTAEAARRRGRSARTIRRLAAAGGIPARRVGSTWWIEEDE